MIKAGALDEIPETLLKSGFVMTGQESERPPSGSGPIERSVQPAIEEWLWDLTICSLVATRMPAPVRRLVFSA